MFRVLGFSLGVRMSLSGEGFGRMPRRCAATLPPFQEKTSVNSIFSFVAEGAAVWRIGLAQERLVAVRSSQMSRQGIGPNKLVWAHSLTNEKYCRQ